MAQASTILFLCTGNYYRSRYAEMLFNHHALQKGLLWRAHSRGLALDRGIYNRGPIAACVLESLARSGILTVTPPRFPIQLTVYDLDEADLVIALKEQEHRPLLTDRFPGWETRVQYWHVHDNDVWPVHQTFASIESRIHELVMQLARTDITSDRPG